MDKLSIKQTLNVIENGDARFTWVKDGVPSFQAWEGDVNIFENFIKYIAVVFFVLLF